MSYRRQSTVSHCEMSQAKAQTFFLWAVVLVFPHPSPLTEWLFDTVFLCNQASYQSVTVEEGRGTTGCQRERATK